MAKAKKEITPKAPKENAEKPAKAPKEITASVGPIAGTLEGQPDQVAKDPAPKAKGKAKNEKLKATLEEQFAAIKTTLEGTQSKDAAKQSRQLRWALKSLDAALDQALRHAQHL